MKFRLAVAAGAVLAFAGAGAAFGAPGAKQSGGDWAPNAHAGAASPLLRASGQHDGNAQHIPPTQTNVELLGKLEMTAPFGNVLRGQIADLAVYKGFAYLMSWAPIDEARQDCRGGVFVADIRDPRKPSQVGFIPALPKTYHGEGAHVITVDTPTFKGDLLAVNNESCESGGAGGFDLYDVTDPRNPKTLVQGFGDTSFDDGDPDTTGNLSGTNPQANSAHSVFLWQAGSKVYAVNVDNVEQAQVGGHDTDIFDVTDPKNPKPVAEFNLYFWFASQNIETFPENTNGNNFFLHDMVVKKIGDRFVLMAAYWDAGYMVVDITDPTNPKYIGDTDFEEKDPLTGVSPPEGNAHQGEFSHDNQYLLAADEDFAPFRAESLDITDGPNAGSYPASDVGGGRSVAATEDHRLNGQVVYGGYGCDKSGAPFGGIPPASTVAFDNSNESGVVEKIVVLQRGPAFDPDEDYDADGDTANDPDDACFPGNKAINAEAAGYDGLVLVNRHQAGGAVGAANTANCGSGAFDPEQTIVTICTTHEAAHHLFNDPPSYGVPADDDQELAARGQVGRHVSAVATFDGWGYAHLYKVGDGKGGLATGKYAAVDNDATSEGLDPRFAFDFGDHSIHEFATDPTENIAYSAYYAGGMRVWQFGASGMQETGAFVDKGGNDFWGVEQFTTPDGERLFAGSDRDFGLYILKYTGPGAAQKPVCESQKVPAETAKPVEVTLKCTDANNNPLTLSIVGTPTNGTLGALTGGKVTYTSKAGFHGTDTFTYRAFDGAAFSDLATVTVVVGRCANRIGATDRSDLIVGTNVGDAISAGRGNDRIESAMGADCVAGESGADQVEGGDGDDAIDGGTGGDRLFGSAGKDGIRGGAGTDHINGGSGNDRIRGDVGNDFVAGGSNNDVVYGGAGRDSIRGEAGNDRLFGGSGNDSIDAGKGANRISGGAGNDLILAVNSRRDVITCGAGRDVVRADRADRVAGSCEVVKRSKTTRRK